MTHFKKRFRFGPISMRTIENFRTVTFNVRVSRTLVYTVEINAGGQREIYCPKCGTTIVRTRNQFDGSHPERPTHDQLCSRYNCIDSVCLTFDHGQQCRLCEDLFFL